MAFCKNGKSIAFRLTAFSFAALALTSLSLTSNIGHFAGPGAVLAADGMEDQESPEKGAKGLFFEQLEKPSQSLNTGLRYWIEMKRNGTTQRVSNKTQFKSGDSIRFHVRSNIDGYAYILLSSGSRGEQSVLFPDEKAGEKNKVGAGREYILPGDGSLTFDENPGTEKLTLLLSRMPIDAQAYLAKPAGEKELTLIASASTGSKDLVPARIYVAYSAPRSDGPPPILIAAANRHAEEKPDTTAKVDKSDKTTKTTRKVEKKVVKTADATAPRHSATTTATTTAGTTTATGSSSKPGNSKRTTMIASSNVRNAKDDEGTTTVVSEKSSGVLHVDVDLDHI